MILRQLLNYLCKSRMTYLKELQKRRRDKMRGKSVSIPSTRYGSDSENRIRANNTKLYDTYIILKKFRRTNAFKILKNELMELRYRNTWYRYAVVPGHDDNNNNHKGPQWFDDASWYPNGKVPKKGEPICEGTITMGRGCSEPIQFYPRDALGLDDSFPDIVMLRGSTVIIPDPDSMRYIPSDKDNNFGDVGHPLEIEFQSNIYSSKEVNALAKDILEKYNIDVVKLSDGNDVTIGKTESGNTIIDIEADKPAFSNRALSIINNIEGKIQEFETISVPSRTLEDAKLISHLRDTMIASTGIPANMMPVGKLSSMPNPRCPKLHELDIIDENGHKLVAIDPIPNSDAFSVRRMGKLTELRKK